MNNIKEIVRKRVRGIFRLRRINKGRNLKMNKLKKTLRKTKGEAFKRKMNKERFRIKELFAGDVGDIFSIGKSVSEMSRQKINSTSFNGTPNALFGRSPRLVATEGQESKTRRKIEMNKLREKASKD